MKYLKPFYESVDDNSEYYYKVAYSEILNRQLGEKFTKQEHTIISNILKGYRIRLDTDLGSKVNYNKIIVYLPSYSSGFLDEDNDEIIRIYKCKDEWFYVFISEEQTKEYALGYVPSYPHIRHFKCDQFEGLKLLKDLNFKQV